MNTAISWFDDNAASTVEHYEKVSVVKLHAWLVDLLPRAPATALDVGAGSGRDAVWLAAQGYEVVAVEPAQAMRTAAVKLHPGAKVQWLAGALPDLQDVATGRAFDLIMLNAVWMYIATADRMQAFGKLISLLKPGGLLAVTLRQGEVEPLRGMHAAPPEEIEQLANAHEVRVERRKHENDLLERQDVSWVKFALRFPMRK